MPSATSFTTQTSLLLWKNWLEKRRRLLSTASEILLPVAFVLLVIWLQTLDPDKDLAEQAYTCPRQSAFTPTLFIPQPKGENFFLEINTEGLGPGVQTVPPFIYLLMLASKTRSLIGLAPGDGGNDQERKEVNEWIKALQNDLDEMTKDLNSPSWGMLSKIFEQFLEFEFCSFGKLSKIFESEHEMREYIRSNDYGQSTWGKGCPKLNKLDKPKLHLALVVNKVGIKDDIWDYTIQTNMSIVPQTYPQLGFINKVDAGVDNRWNDMYMMSGFLTMQLMVDRYVLNKTISVDENVEALARQQLCDSLDPFVQNFNASDISPSLLLNFSCMPALNKAIKELKLSTKPLTTPVSYIPNDIRMAQFPTAAYTDREFYLKIENVFALILIITFLWPVSRLIRGLVHEKETKIREGMRMMGLKILPLFVAWFITYGIIFLLIALVITGVAQPHLFSRSDPSLVFSYLFLFGIDIIGYCFLISVIFNKAKTASIAGVTLFFMGFFAYFAVASDNASRHAKASSCILAPTAFGLGASILAKYEGAGVGVSWGNMHETPNETEISFAHVLGAMIFDSFLYLFLSFYLDNVIQHEYGVSRPFYFLCSPKYWFGSRSKVETISPDNVDGKKRNDKIILEEVSSELLQLEREGRCVRLDGLRKVFKNSVGEHTAVNDMDLSMYEGQIFVLLGHNGAGKTTTISMLTGLIAPTCGTATVYGNDITTDMDELRTMLGVCPQYDVLFDDLTVREHLVFFAKLKGIENIDEVVERQISEVGLEEKAHDLSSQLSGGQKRKLSVAIALIGDSKIIFLDEPTSRMDVWARRHTWNLLQSNKNGRIIILTTHFMDEADILGDRIAIMADGELQCVGSPLFLKSQYGVGYTLTFILDEATTKDKKEALVERVQEYSPDARVLSNVGAEVAIQVPLHSSHTFPEMFSEFDQNLKSYGISGYGASVTTLEEVFMKVGEKHLKNEVDSVMESEQQARNLNNNEGNGGIRVPLLSDGADIYDDETSADSSDSYVADLGEYKLFMTHFRAMFLKRFNYAKRDRKSICCNTLLPVVLLVLGLTLLKVFPAQESPALQLDLDQFGQSVNFVPYNVSNLEGNSRYWARDIFSTHINAATFVDADIPRGMENQCRESNGTDIPDGSNMRGLSEWLLHHAHDNYTSMFGAFQLDKGDIHRGGSEAVSATILTNSTSFHGPGIFLNLLNQVLLRNMSGSKDSFIKVSSHPFPFTAKVQALLSSFTAVSAAIVIMIAFSFVPAAIAIFIVKEREISAKHQQLISGASVYAYWSASYAWDMCMYLIPWVCTCVCVRLFGITAFQGENLVPVFLLFLGYGFAAIPFTYCLSYFFKSHSNAQNLILLINFITGLVLMIASFVMSLIESTHSINKTLQYVYRLFPGFCLGNGLLNLTIRSSIKTFGSGIIEIHSPYSWGVVGSDLTYLFLGGLVYFLLTIGIDLALSYPKLLEWFSGRKLCSLLPFHRRIRNIRAFNNEYTNLSRTSSSIFDVDADIDVDVSNETERVKSGRASSDTIVLNQLKKIYSNGKEAVKELSFGVPAGECFGFLGTNGAGKTTTLKIITGDIIPTSGEAHLNGLNILTEQSRIRRLIGYCPQFDALLEHLTCREHLELFGRLKCFSGEKLEKIVRQKLTEMNLKEYENITAGALSGGNKRKLSVAIALIGKPSLVFLDEPSGPMDVVNKRFMWDVISRITEEQKDTTIVLTSHSMEECEALCTRVGIMVEGNLKCIGPIQHLKSRFGKGLIVDIKMCPPTKNGIGRILASLRNKRSDFDMKQSSRRRRSMLQPRLIVETFNTLTHIYETLQFAPAPFPDKFLVEVVHVKLQDDFQNHVVPGMVITYVNDLNMEGVGFEDVLSTIKECAKGGAVSISFEGSPLIRSTSITSDVSDETAQHLLYAFDIPGACEKLGDESLHQRFTELDSSGWVIASALEKDGYITEEKLCEWWLSEMTYMKLEELLARSFSVVECLERRGEHSKWRVEGTDKTLGQVFEILESNKLKLRITEYSVSQASLEQIFVYFASQQEAKNAALIRGVSAV